MDEISIDELRVRLDDLLDETAATGIRTAITCEGRRIAAIVPVEEAEGLEDAENAYLLRLAEADKSGA